MLVYIQQSCKGQITSTCDQNKTLRFSFLNSLQLLFHHLQTVSHALFEFREGSDTKLLLDLGKLLLFLLELLAKLLDLVLKLKTGKRNR